MKKGQPDACDYHTDETTRICHAMYKQMKYLQQAKTKSTNPCSKSTIKAIGFFFFQLGFTPCRAEQPLRCMELLENEAQKDYSIQEICLERTYSSVNRCLLILDLKPLRS